MIRTFLMVLAGIAFVASSSAQMITPQVVAAGGNQFTNTQANLMISFTIGEMAQVETFSAQGYHLTQGFHQPTYDFVGIEEEEFVELFEVYPNPASENLNVRYALKYPGNLEMKIFNMNGVEVVDVFDKRYSGGLEIHHFDLSQVAQGMYFLQVRYRAPGRSIDHISHFKINVINP